jgi:uncharacterized membrane protein YoaK (UPF0700 family)
MNNSVMTRLLSFNAGFVDTVGFLGLQGLFAAHVTGNFVTLAAGFVYGPHGTIGKILALPEFIGAVAVARLLGAALTAREMPTLTILLGIEAIFLAVFLALGAVYGPFPNSDVLPALAAAFAGVAAMALQNAMQRVHFPGEPSTAIMTNRFAAAFSAQRVASPGLPADVQQRRFSTTLYSSGASCYPLQSLWLS